MMLKSLANLSILWKSLKKDFFTHYLRTYYTHIIIIKLSFSVNTQICTKNSDVFYTHIRYVKGGNAVSSNLRYYNVSE